VRPRQRRKERDNGHMLRESVPRSAKDHVSAPHARPPSTERSETIISPTISCHLMSPLVRQGNNRLPRSRNTCNALLNGRPLGSDTGRTDNQA